MPPSLHEDCTIVIDGEEIPYILKRSARRKRTVELQPDTRSVFVMLAPVTMTPLQIEDFLISKSEWILKQLRCARPARNWDNSETIPYRGKQLQVIVGPPLNKPSSRTPTATVTPSLDKKHLLVSVTEGVEGAQRQQAVDNALLGWYRREAKEYLNRRIREWIAITGWEPTRVRISNAKRRWGSCSERRSINLNWRLIMIPDELSDYVLVHELSHLQQLNHSQKFWNLLNSIIPDSDQRRRKLREYSSAQEL